MMTQTRTVKKNTNKKARKAASRYQTVRALRKAGENLADRARGYNADYIQRPVKSGKTFFEELTDDPRQTIDTLADDGRELFQDLRKDARKKVDGYLKDGRKFYRQAGKDPRGKFDDLVADGKVFFKDLGSEAKDRVDDFIKGGREVIESLEKDTRLAAEELLASGKKAFEKLPGQAAGKESETLLIKKYVNGRFYDTVNKKYLKKNELARLVRQQKKIKIIFTKTGKDVTRSVVSGLSTETKNGKKAIPAADELVNWIKENQKRAKETIDRQLGNVRKTIKFPG
jgi:hypothetical protein